MGAIFISQRGSAFKASPDSNFPAVTALCKSCSFQGSDRDSSTPTNFRLHSPVRITAWVCQSLCDQAVCNRQYLALDIANHPIVANAIAPKTLEVSAEGLPDSKWIRRNTLLQKSNNSPLHLRRKRREIALGTRRDFNAPNQSAS